MLKQLTLILVSITLSNNILAQDRNEGFKLILPETKVANSLYKRIEYMDTRQNPSMLGMVQLGAFNRKTKVVPGEPMQQQFENLISSLTDPTAGDGKLLFVVRRFAFTEVTKAFNETGYFYARGTLFSDENGTYKIVGDLDTILEFRAADVTQRLLRTGSKILTDFIEQNLAAKPSGQESFSYEDALKIDSIRKLSVPVYNVASYKDGVYKDYEEFSNQSPGILDFNPVIKSGSLKKIMVKDETGKEKAVNGDDIYAVVIDGKPFVATRFGYYPLEKRNNDFYYTGKIKTFDQTGAVVGQLMFGIAGALLAGSNSEIADFKVDYISGGFLYAGKPGGDNR